MGISVILAVAVCGTGVLGAAAHRAAVVKRQGHPAAHRAAGDKRQGHRA
jgi:hypothetical protein